MKPNLQIITAALLSLAGLVLLFIGMIIAPSGEIHETVLVAFGEVATFAGALFGIDAVYTKKLWEFTKSIDKNRKGKPFAEQSKTKQDSKHPPLRTPTTSSQPEPTN